ncbi:MULTISPECIES: MFS transporter [unclassified Acidovorax]|jgi:predicted MFS family arabinose efflux permease|uniref:MFS transporter n=1 Tax=unclassified Acidovorax TaxID=2684926 RepID=UPI000B3FEBD5|nr:MULTISPECIES: MFS transporter [unclassified Acidovorax]MBP3979443.1 MFS transporter [Acidovorax sp. JG5]
MSPALLALSACTFALGFAEFVAVSLVPSITASTGISVGSVGMMIGIYAIGVSIGAPTLSALLARAPRPRVLAISMLLFAAGNATTALTSSLPLLWGSRFLAGLMHGVVIALAASTAAVTAGPERSGNAIAMVFGGLTLALILGVPLGTLAGGYFRWQDVFIGIAVIGALSAAALLRFTPVVQSGHDPASTTASVGATLGDRGTLHPVSLTALVYCGSFTGFTYISVLLEKATGLGSGGVTGMFFLYGVSAAAGNAFGGRFVDRVGSRAASLSVVIGIFVALAGAYAGATSAAAMAVVMVIWGLASFGAVPVLQKTVLVAAQHNPRGSPELASGMNIAAFNLGIAGGSLLGGWASHHGALMPMAVGFAPLIFAAVLAFRLGVKPASLNAAQPVFSKPGV